jgi:hypothetical protein
MTVSVARDGAIMLEGNCPLEDAEPLLQLLRRHPGEPVDWRRCNALHTAIVQVLMAAQPRIRGPAGSALLRRWIEPALSGQAISADAAAAARRDRDAHAGTHAGGAGKDWLR